MARLSSKRKTAEKFGRRGESLAILYLRLKFYSILAKRVKTPVGEIDLVARRGKDIVFIEVKARSDKNQVENALRSVNQRRISRAAGYYLTQFPEIYHSQLRFDVIFLAPFSWPRHVIGAFNYME